MMISFYKMHGLGNDFLVMDGISERIDSATLPIKKWSHRYLGIGFDQLLLILPSHKADIACQIFNADGSEAEQCGNGMRCIARFAYDKKLVTQRSLSIETKAGIVHATVLPDEQIEVDMGRPCFEPTLIPFQTDKIRKLYELTLDDGQPGYAVSVLSMGNPHAILQVNSIKTFPVTSTAPIITAHRAFPRGVNVGFMEIVTPQHIRLRTIERGVGETLACGSNACAAVVAGILNNSLQPRVRVELQYGDLWISWDGSDRSAVIMQGLASYVFAGTAL